MKGMESERVIAPEPWPAELALFDRWLESANMPLSTRRMRNYQLRRFAVEVAKPPYDVSLDDLVGHLSNPNWQANSKAAARSALRGFYKWATISERIGRNPAESVPVVRVPRGQPRPAAEDVIEAAIAEADPRVALLINIGSRSGLRCCELAAIHSRDVERRGKRWALRVRGKGSKVRIVPLSKKMAKTIRSGGGYLFPGRIDGHISAAYVSRLVSRAMPPGVTAHQLRHRFATVTLRGSKDLRAVQEMMGHASLATTQVYTQVAEDDMWTAAAFAA